MATRPDETAHATEMEMKMSTKTKADQIKDLTAEGLHEAYQGSWYTICGCGGEMQDWLDGYEKIMAEEGIGTPSAWYRTTGGSMNAYLMGVGDPTQSLPIPIGFSDMFQEDLVILMFPHTGLAMGKLAIFKIGMEDRWFDDIVDNARRRAQGGF